MNSEGRNIGALIGGTVLIGFGILALLGQLFSSFHFWATYWPFTIIAVGILFFIVMLSGGKSAAPFAIPGSIILVNGLMLLFQNLTGQWESWSYGWTVIVFSVGLGIYLMGLWSGESRQKESGLKVMKVGVILFVVFGAFFELIFSAFQPVGIRQIVFPALLILLGVYLVITRSGLLSSRHNQDETPQSDTNSSQSS